MNLCQTTFLAAGLLAVLLPLAAAQPPAQRVGPAAPDVRKLLDDLDSPRFAVRERATKALLRLREKALAPLKNALAAPRSAEFARRAQAILRQLAIYEPGGEISNGLKLCLTADRDSVKVGESLKLTTTLCNMTEKPLTVRVGYSYCGNYFERGSTLRLVQPDPKGKELLPQWQVGFCGTGAYPLYVTVPPRSVLAYTTAGAVLRKDNKTYLGTGAGGGHHFLLLETPADKLDTLRMALEVTPEENRGLGHYRKSNLPVPAVTPEACWNGKARSNDVRVRVLP
jgi:hypothetical protein